MLRLVTATPSWEDYFPCPTNLHRRYARRVNRGNKAMACRRAVICGLARDIERRLPTTIAGLEAIGERFADYRIVVYENDSSDNTAGVLRRWSYTNHRVTLLSEAPGDAVNPPVRCLERAARMARYRNACVEHLRRLEADSAEPFDYVLVADMDLDGGWSLEGLATTFARDDWDFVGSQGVIHKRTWRGVLPLQYDSWAFRKIGDDQPLSTSAVNRLRWPRGGKFVPVGSCFGGLGVYRAEVFRHLDYGPGDCEHVVLHRAMREAGFDRLFLNPSQFAYYGIRRSRWVRKWEQTLRKMRSSRPAVRPLPIENPAVLPFPQPAASSDRAAA